MEIKLGSTHYKNFPGRFEDNKNERPIPIIEFWFNDLDKLRINRDGFLMPSTDTILFLKLGLDDAIKGLDDASIIKQVVQTEEKLKGGNKQMEHQKSIKDEALSYESKSTLNISDLPQVSTDLLLEERNGTDAEGKKFSYKVVVVDGQDYRVPVSVLKNLRIILEENPKLKFFKVKKFGKGMATEYTIIPL